MTQQEYENKIKELENQIAELRIAKVEAEQPKRWKPNLEEYEDYWFLNSNSDISATSWSNDDFDKWRYLTGNCFKTEEEVEEYKKQIEYTARYKNYIEEHSEPIDWNDGDQLKYYAQFCYNDYNKIKVDTLYYHRTQGTIYASSEQIILDAIEKIGEDNFKKYVLGVK